jgi:hypothetical protein
MVELVTTVIVTASSVVLFAYWLRCAYSMMRGSYPPPDTAILSNAHKFSRKGLLVERPASPGQE